MPVTQWRGDTRTRRARRSGGGVAAGAIALVLVWHAWLTIELRARLSEAHGTELLTSEGASISMNPLTNFVSIEINSARTDDGEASSIGEAFGRGVVESFGPGFIERELNAQARKRFDVYAMVLPYRAEISFTERSEAAR
jgi:hypothetical protein